MSGREERRIKHRAQISGLSNWVNDGASYQHGGESGGGTGLEVKLRVSFFWLHFGEFGGFVVFICIFAFFELYYI